MKFLRYTSCPGIIIAFDGKGMISHASRIDLINVI